MGSTFGNLLKGAAGGFGELAQGALNLGAGAMRAVGEVAEGGNPFISVGYSS